MMVRKLFSLLLAALLLAAVGPLHLTAHADTFTLGLSLPTTSGVFYEGLANGAFETAKDAGVSLIIVDAENDVDTELANVQSLIDQGVDAILINPIDSTLSLPAIEAANTAKIPVFLLGSEINTSDTADVSVTSLITVDNAQGGAAAAKALCDALKGEGTAVEMISTPPAPTDEDTVESPEVLAQRERISGFETAMADKCAKVTLLPLEAADLDHDAVQQAFVDLVKQQKVNGVFAPNDKLILAALEGSIIARRGGMTFIGFDASDDAVAAIQQGLLKAVITTSAWKLGEVGIQTATAYLQGETVENSVQVDVTVLDSSSIETFRCSLAGGCHR
jgi:ribose transport system substrate-binding protein